MDLLPTLSGDPWAVGGNRDEVHRDRRRILETFCDSLKLRVVVPARVVSPAGGPFGKESLDAPFTRIPVGENADRDLPSLLDFFAESGGIISDSWVDWLPGCGDHALVSALVECVVEPLRPQRGKWHCAAWDTAVSWMAEHSGPLSACGTATDCNAFFLNAQDVLQGRRSCAQRRHDRIPEHIRSVLRQASTTTCELERRTLRSSVARLCRDHRQSVDEERARFTVKSGRFFRGPKNYTELRA